jgi:hypothetical protein
MTLISSVGFTKESIENLKEEKLDEKPIPLDITLDEPIIITHNNMQLYAWPIEGYATILQIFNGYSLWADTYIDKKKKDSLWALRLDLCRQEKNLEVTNFKLALDDRERMYEVWREEQKDYRNQQTKNTIKAILISTGVGVVCVLVGIPIGFFLAR